MEQTPLEEQIAGFPPELQAQCRKWVADHEEIAIFVTSRGPCIFRPPSQNDYERFVDRVANDKNSKAVALRELAQVSVLYPELPQLRIIFEKKPALPTAIGNRLVELAGGTNAGEVAKA
jgi:hypothetical protein